MAIDYRLTRNHGSCIHVRSGRFEVRRWLLYHPELPRRQTLLSELREREQRIELLYNGLQYYY